MLKEIIKNLPQQLDYEPLIENAGSFQKHDKYIICGMGGSNLATGIIKSWKPKLDIIIHRDYGLPDIKETELKDYLVIASSYSGNTEETISGFEEALARKLPLIVIATGGKLLELAQKNNVPYINFPSINNNPRFAIGYSIRATLKAMGEESILNDMSELVESLITEDYETIGKKLAEKLQDKMPLIYSSGTNAGLARYWKISFNETAKIPAFYNFVPELNHNEMVGFSGKLNQDFAFIFLDDPDDAPQIQKRITATKKIFEDRGFTILAASVTGPSLWHKSFASVLTAMWTSYFLAKDYGTDPSDISMIENFKKTNPIK
ncbi:MAG: bifunctional phosphoglucose/phosphomannose isomerase [Candidatus Yanofskybacteria bacterium]|nr:bifunctional phosphoglucose/phosphomannose isomerase [Candidatus Yanofskybacteria bacterium]